MRFDHPQSKHDGLVHAQGSDGNDYTLCGVALDGEYGDIYLTSARPGEFVTCPGYREVIRYCKTFKRNRQPGEPSHG